MQIWRSVKKCQNFRFFDIFLNILHKMSKVGSRACIKGASILPGKNWNNFLCYPWKIDSLSSFDPTFPPVPP